MPRKAVVIPLLLACVTGAVHAESMILEVIPLQHRTLDDVIPVIQPLLVEGGTVTGMNNQLIVKTTPANLDEIKQILATIDTQLRRLMIIVKQDSGRQGTESDAAWSGGVSSGDVKLESTDPRRGRQGTRVTVGDKDGDHATYSTRVTQTNADDKNAFRVQTVEGQAAFIQAGQSVPLPEQSVTLYPDRAVVQRGVEYRDATSGFYVLPRLNGDKVTLLVSPHMSRVLPGRIPSFEVQDVETTASGRLGEWIRIGGIDQEITREGRENFSTSREHSEERRSILVKVEEIP